MSVGDYFTTIVDTEVTPEEAGSLGQEILRWLVERGIVLADPNAECVLAGVGYPPGPNVEEATEEANALRGLLTCGMELIDRREVHWTLSDGFRCRQCQTLQEDLDETLEDWTAGGDGLLRCSACGWTAPISDWDSGEPPWGFGNLAFKFWNWSPLRSEFVAEITRRLAHKVVVPYDKL